MLTNKQIDLLFIYCQKHFVRYYDVQVELAANLANAIETKMANDSNLTFEKALEDVHQSFGVKGFTPMVSEKRIAAEKQNRKKFWNFFKNQFRWPKVLGFIIFLAVMFTLFSINTFIFRWVFISLFSIGWIIEIYSVIHIHLVLSRTGKKFLLREIAEYISWILFPFYVFYFPSIFDKDFLANNPPATLILFHCILLGLFLILSISILQTINFAKRDLIKTFPKVFSAA